MWYNIKMHDAIKIKIILGSTRQGRFSDKIGIWVLEQIKKHQNVEGEILDLKEFNLPFYDEIKDKNVEKFSQKIKSADGFIIIAPEYNHGIPAVLKNALDWCYEEWNYKPVAFVGYGGVGAARSIEQLKLIAIELRMIPVRNTVHILGNRYFPYQEGKITFEDLVNDHNETIHDLIHELLWLAKIFKEDQIRRK